MTEAAAFVSGIPHSNRQEVGSENILPVILPKTILPDDLDCAKLAVDVVDTLNARIATRDFAGLAALFTREGAWRDHLGLSFALRSFLGPQKIGDYLKETGSVLKSIALDDETLNRRPAAANVDVEGKTPCVQLYLTFVTTIGSGRGVARVVFEDETAARSRSWKIITFYTALQQLTGFEESIGDRRPLGASHGSDRNMKNWIEQRIEDSSFTKREPAVLIIGAGQGGLTAAARLRMLQVPTLVVDREQRVGDNWRGRYRQLVLHDPVWYDHLPYLRFPPSWPAFTPKDKLADFFESYVRLLELDVWTRTEITSLSYDAAKKHYNVKLSRQRLVVDEHTGAVTSTVNNYTIHPRHVIQATGHSGKKNMPDIPGIDSFAGSKWHSSEFPGASPQDSGTSKRRAVIVGACNSAHDIAQDFYENGYDVTIVQRSSTCVVSSQSITEIGLKALYSESAQRTIDVEDADLLYWSRPTPISKALEQQVARRQAENDYELLSKLQKAGFQIDIGVNGAGLIYKYYQRGGGYYIDVGASQLIIDGRIKVKSGQEIQEVFADGIKLADGTHLLADELVFATGYQNMRSQTKLLFGGELADRCGDVWGFNKEGEFRIMWQRSGHPGYWFMGGNLAITRHFSRVLALQIKAQEEGLMPYE